MKILSISQIREADKYTIKYEPISSIDLMERAASVCYHWIISHFREAETVAIFCGLGNNGGDGLAIARLLGKTHKYKIDVYIFRLSENMSNDFAINYERLKQCENIKITEVQTEQNLPFANKNYDLGIDCIFGSGLNKPIAGWLGEIIQQINSAKINNLIAIDIPSGLFADKHTPDNSPVIKASHTLTFGFPKLAFMFPESGKFVGNFHVLDIGLHKDFINSVETDLFYIDKHFAEKIHKPRSKFSHKGIYGHALIIAGSYGKMGAAVLSATSCLRSGAGLVTAHLPSKGIDIMQISTLEVMVSIDNNKDIYSSLPDELEKYNAIGIGPGLGTHQITYSAFSTLLDNVSQSLVVDADAINLLALHPYLISKLPENTILTPHVKEFERLVGKTANDFDRFEKQKAFSKKHKVIIILKGAHTCIILPDGRSFFNSTGNPGMATAGMGDVLTGIITGLLAQGYTPEEAAIYAVFIHGKAGDLAVRHRSESSLIASDLFQYL